MIEASKPVFLPAGCMTGAGFSSAQLIQIQSADSIYPEVNCQAQPEEFQKETSDSRFMFVAPHKCTLQKFICAQKSRERETLLLVALLKACAIDGTRRCEVVDIT